MIARNSPAYIIGIDQSTQGTKALLLDEKARLVAKAEVPHKQKISKEGYISHDPREIYQNTLYIVKHLVEAEGIDKRHIKAIGISNQRETTVAWNRESKEPICDAVVWQCARASEVCEKIKKTIKEEGSNYILTNTGIPLSVYFPAAKMRWILDTYQEARKLMQEGKLCMGTMDVWLVYCLTQGEVFKTEYSNASRTQLLNLHTLGWDHKIVEMFGLSLEALPEICDSNARFGRTTLEGYLEEAVPITAVLGDSHSALFGQGCYEKGMVKATYGTGSSLMMNIGDHYIQSRHGIVTSLAWGIDGKVTYVFEGNIHYTGGVITWLKEDCKLITSPEETQQLAMQANQEDTTYLVPAFSGIGAPHWRSDAKALIYGMSRTTGRAEIVKAALECIGYQVIDILQAMGKDTGLQIKTLRVDGGATSNEYLMQFQSDLGNMCVQVPDTKEISGLGVAYMAGMGIGLYTKEEITSHLIYREYEPKMEDETRQRLLSGWKQAVQKCY